MGGVGDDNSIGIDIAVGNQRQLTIISLQLGETQSDILHCSLKILCFDLIANAEWFLPEQQHAGEEILQYVLEGETYSDGRNSQATDDTGHAEVRNDDDGRG